MSSPIDRTAEKNLQIAALNQKMESLQAQLSGAQRRASQLTAESESLRNVIAERDSEIKMLRMELERTNQALEAVGKEVREARAEQSQLMAKTRPSSGETTAKEHLEMAIREARAARDDLRRLSEAATAMLNSDAGALEMLKQVVLEVGDPRYRILNMVLQKRQVKIDEIAATLLKNNSEVLPLIEELQNAGEVELRDGATVIPARKYRVVRVPIEEWENASPVEILEQLIDVVARTEGHENVADAILAAVNILEQKLARGGALVFQMRRAVTTWKSGPGDVQQLQYTIREWKARAAVLS